MDKFWMIISIDGSSTSVRHNDVDKAILEIERLTRKENKLFVLLESIQTCEPQFTPVEWQRCEDRKIDD